MPVGILSTAVYIPDSFITGREIAKKSSLPVHIVEEKMGIKRKPVPGPFDHTCEMGIKAAKKAIAKANINPLAIDLIIYIGEEHKEYPLWTSAIKLQEAIGARNAWAFDTALRCGTTIMAIKIAKDMMNADHNIQTVLLAGGYRNGDLINYRNKRTRFIFNLGAGGGALLLQKGLKENVVLESCIVTDGSFSEDVVVRGGGTKNPLTRDNLHLFQFDVPDPEGMKKRLDEKSLKNFLYVIRCSLEKSDYSEKDIGYLALLHMKRSAHDYVLKELNLSQESTVYLENYGHIGQIDQILSLQLAEHSGKLKDGTTVVLVSAGIGYAWGAVTIRWGNGG